MADLLENEIFLILLQFVTLFGSGIVAGFTFYITKIELPSRVNESSHYQLTNYQHVFPLAASFMKPCGVVLTIVNGLTVYTTGNVFWVIPLIMIGGLGPFTAKFIQPTNQILMSTDENNSQKVRKELSDWTRLHNVRTYMSLLGFAGACIAALRQS